MSRQRLSARDSIDKTKKPFESESRQWFLPDVRLRFWETVDFSVLGAVSDDVSPFPRIFWSRSTGWLLMKRWS
jgi:hypothetical protein